jgi:hypothetical protein
MTLQCPLACINPTKASGTSSNDTVRGYGDDIDKAERVLREIVTAHAKVLEDITIPFPQRDVHVQGSTEPG